MLKKVVGIVVGFIGLFGYFGGLVVVNVLVGYMVDYFGWDGGFKLLIGVCLLVILFFCLILCKFVV